MRLAKALFARGPEGEQGRPVDPHLNICNRCFYVSRTFQLGHWTPDKLISPRGADGRVLQLYCWFEVN